MLTVNIKIENNNLQKAKTELEALLVLVNTLAETYETTFDEVKPEAEKAPEKKAPAKRKPRTTKPKPEPKEEVKEEVKEEAPVETDGDITIGDLTALAKKAVASAGRDEVKDLIASFGTGKLSSVDEGKYAELKVALEAL